MCGSTMLLMVAMSTSLTIRWRFVFEQFYSTDEIGFDWTGQIVLLPLATTAIAVGMAFLKHGLIRHSWLLRWRLQYEADRQIAQLRHEKATMDYERALAITASREDSDGRRTSPEDDAEPQALLRGLRGEGTTESWEGGRDSRGRCAGTATAYADVARTRSSERPGPEHVDGQPAPLTPATQSLFSG